MRKYIRAWILRIFTRWRDSDVFMPQEEKTLFISNGRGWTSIGCLVYLNDSWYWGEMSAGIYQENDEIIAECELDDLDVRFWHPFPKKLIKRGLK